MTVAELIEALNKIEDKSLKVEVPAAIYETYLDTVSEIAVADTVKLFT
jgi:hypothetical protein|nr:MAG TPA: hypothetical protein [Caudoviricetes sp.]